MFKKVKWGVPSSHCTSARFVCLHVWMWELDYKESWALKNWHFLTVVLEKTLGSPLDCKEIQPAHPKGHQSWVFTGRTDVEAETPVLWPPHSKSWLIWKDPDAGKDWGQEEKGMTEDEMAGWHHWLDGHGFGWTPGVADGQGGLACCGSWGCKELDTTEWLNWTESQREWNEPQYSSRSSSWCFQNLTAEEKEIYGFLISLESILKFRNFIKEYFSGLNDKHRIKWFQGHRYLKQR